MRALDVVRGRAGVHTAKAWKLLIGVATFLAVLAMYSTVVGLRVLALIAIALSVPIAFISGYCYRQDVLDRGDLPWFRWLWLEEDLDDQEPHDTGA